MNFVADESVAGAMIEQHRSDGHTLVASRVVTRRPTLRVQPTEGVSLVNDDGGAILVFRRSALIPSIRWTRQRRSESSIRSKISASAGKCSKGCFRTRKSGPG